MEINLENKAKFFAQHWGQHVIKDVNNSGDLCTYPVHPSNMYRFEESHLELKSLASITEEDVIQLAKIMISEDAIEAFIDSSDSDGLIISLKDSRAFQWFLDVHFPTLSWEVLDEAQNHNEPEICTVLKAYDFLRSKGYALSWMGLSVEEMVQAGWIKLTKSLQKQT